MGSEQQFPGCIESGRIALRLRVYRRQGDVLPMLDVWGTRRATTPRSRKAAVTRLLNQARRRLPDAYSYEVEVLETVPE